MLGFPEEPQVLRWKALQSGIHLSAGAGGTVGPGELDFLTKSEIWRKSPSGMTVVEGGP